MVLLSRSLRHWEPYENLEKTHDFDWFLLAKTSKNPGDFDGLAIPIIGRKNVFEWFSLAKTSKKPIIT